MTVIDASAVLDVVLRTERGRRLTASVLDPTRSLAAPELIDIEFLQVLRRFARSGRISDVRAIQALEDYRDLPIERYPHLPFLSRAWELRHTVSAYDAVYVVLAEALDAPLLTTDDALSRAIANAADIRVRLAPT